MLDRLDGESQKNFSMYQVYQNMGVKRSLAKVSEQISCSTRWLEKLSSKYDWVNRAELFDTHQLRIQYDAMKKEVKDMGKRQASYSLQMITSLMTPAQELLKRLKNKEGKLDFGDLSDTELINIVSRCANAFKLLSDVERLARGEPTNIEQMQLKPKVDVNFIDRIGNDEESAKLATELLTRIKGTN